MASGRATPTSPRSSGFQTFGAAVNSPETASVRVALRIRPPSDDDNAPARFQRAVVHPLPNSSTALTVESNQSLPGQAARVSNQTYAYDRVFAASETQEAVYASVSDLIDKFLQGYFVTIFAYGQTSSGKSYTMGTDCIDISEVDEDRLGITPRVVAAVFKRVAQMQDGRTTCTVKNSYLELYQEELYDLLNTSAGERPPIAIREEKSGAIHCTGLTEDVVSSPEQVMNNLRIGSLTRQTGSTDMNAQSSRSHAIFTLTLTTTRSNSSSLGTPGRPQSRSSRLPSARTGTPGGRPGTPSQLERPGSRMGAKSPLAASGRATPSPNTADDDLEVITTVSKLHLVDLAGSERLKRTSATGDRVKEGISINAGLHALGNVISALSNTSKQRPSHIPYRDSKLTRLLQDSLGGNAYTLMIACISATEYNLPETLNTLQFASRAKNIKNMVTLNESEEGWEEVGYLQRLVTKLRGELAATKGDLVHPSGPPLIAERQDPDDSHRHSKGSLTPQEFATAASPVISVYEQAISALESQLSLKQTALVYTEAALKDSEDEAQRERQALLTATEQLNATLSKLRDREASSEAYIADLELKIKTSVESADSHGGLVTDLRKDLSRSKDSLQNAQDYIASLEEQLAATAAKADSKLKRSSRPISEDVPVPAESGIQQLALRTLESLVEELAIRARELQHMQESQAAGPVGDKSSDLPGVVGDSNDLLREIAALKDRLAQAAPTRLLLRDQASQAVPSISEDVRAEVVALREENEALLRQMKAYERSPSPLNIRNGLPALREDHVDRLFPSPTIPLSPGRIRRSLSHEPAHFLEQAPSPLQRSDSESRPFLSSSLPSPSASSSPGARIGRRISSPSLFMNEMGINTYSPPARSSDSFAKEINALTKALLDREAEIAVLEQRIKDSTDDSSAANTTSAPSATDSDSADLVHRERKASAVLSPSTQAILTSLESERMDANGASQEQLLVSMARKEAAYREDIESLREILSTLQAEKAAVEQAKREQLSVASQEVEALTQQLADCRQELGTVQAQYSKAMLEVRSHAEQLESHSLQALELKNFMAEVEREHHNEVQRLSAAKSSQSADATVHLQLRSVELEKDSAAREALLRAQVQGLQEELSAAQGRVSSIQSSIADNTEVPRPTAGDLDDVHAKHTNLMQALRHEHSAQIEEHQRETSNGMAELEERLQREATSYKKAQANAEDQVKALNQKHAALLQHIAQLQAKESTLLEESARHKTRSEATSQQLQDALNSVSIERGNGALLAEELAKLDASLLEVTRERNDAHTKLSEARGLLEKFAEQSKDLASARAQIAELTARLGSNAKSEELREALDALGTLEKALLESTEEKELLRSQLVDLEQRLAAKPKSDSAELQRVIQHQKATVAQLQRQLTALQQQGEDGGMLPEVLKTPTLSTSPSSDGDTSGAATPPLLPNSIRLSTSKMNSTLPPPRPPPSASLPPLPAGAPEPPPNPRASVASIGRPHDSLTTRGSTASLSTLDSLAMDTKRSAKHESSEVLITKLTQQLAHCEKDLKANLDLVQMLESALNDTERTLRKTKVQISTVAGERDAANRTNDSLKQQIGGLKAELDTLRTARDTDQNRYQQEQRQKDVARIELQEKLELLKQRKSKLNCF